MEKRIKFDTSRDVSNPDVDAIKVLFPFTVVDSSLIGTPAEKEETKYHKIIVGISGPRQASWKSELQLKEIDWEKVLFQYCLRQVEGKVRTQSLQPFEEIDLSDEECPDELPELEEPSGFEIMVEEEKPKIGFHCGVTH